MLYFYYTRRKFECTHANELKGSLFSKVILDTGHYLCARTLEMEHYFELPVTYKGETSNLKARLVTFAYSYTFYIIIDGQELRFEKDDEGVFRVIADKTANKPVDPDLLKKIVAILEELSMNKKD